MKMQLLKKFIQKNQWGFLFAFFNFMGMACAQQISVHDPVMIKENDRYYLFATGFGISTWSSTDKLNWTAEKPVFNKAPEWTFEKIPGFKGHIWAPDISQHKGKYYLYYSISAFAKNTSCIGVVINTTLDSKNKNYNWEDHGVVLQSEPNRDMWNAIDPNLVFDENQVPWMVFGSFWEGIKMVKMDTSLLKIAEPQEWYSLARHERDKLLPDTDPGNGAVEAPFIVFRNGYYYLFISIDYCCRGLKSNYKIVVGRSENIQGPYTDKLGNSLLNGGGTQVIMGNIPWPGYGHNAVYTFENNDFILFHAYDPADNGKPKLILRELYWNNEGWPTAEANEK